MESESVNSSQLRVEPEKGKKNHDIMEQRIKSGLESLENHLAKSTELLAGKWDSWSVAVRYEFIKRVQMSLLANVQMNTKKKQAQQWTVTVKFVIEDYLQVAREACSHKFDDSTGEKWSAPRNIAQVLRKVAIIKDEDWNEEEFEKRVDEMMDEMKKKSVPQFAVDVSSRDVHLATLKKIRALYLVEWAMLLISKLLSSSN